MKLNPRKCAFGVQLGMLLGFMISSRRIEENPDKVKAVLNMRIPRNIKEV